MDSIFEDQNFQDTIANIIDNSNDLKNFDIDQEIDKLIDIIMSAVNDKFKNSDNLMILSVELKKEILKNIKIIISSLVKSSKKDIAHLIVHQFVETFNKTKNREEKISFKLSQKDRERVKEELKRMAIYEEYKATNPKRIAGETKFENFLNNMNLGGLKLAMKYEGGSKKDLKNYSKDLVEELNKQHKNNKGKNGWSR